MNPGGATSSSPAFDGQHPPVIGQRMQHHGGVLAGFHHLVEVADGAAAHGPGEWAVVPDGVAIADQVPADQVGGRQIVVAAHRHQRPAQPCRHVFDEAGLAAAGGALDQQRQALVEGVLEERDLASLLRVEGKTAGFGRRQGGGDMAGAAEFHHRLQARLASFRLRGFSSPFRRDGRAPRGRWRRCLPRRHPVHWRRRRSWSGR